MAVISYVTNVFLTVNKRATDWRLHLWQIELIWPSASIAWSNLNCLPDFTMLSVDAWVLFQITQHAVETYSTAVMAEMD